MSVRRPLVDATRATADGAAKADLVAGLRRLVRDVRSGTGLEVELQLGPRVPATAARGMIEQLSRAVEKAVADAKLRGATSVEIELRAGIDCVALAVSDDRGGLLLTAAALQ
jgi:signal transduction histidine kinase